MILDKTKIHWHNDQSNITMLAHTMPNTSFRYHNIVYRLVHWEVPQVPLLLFCLRTYQIEIPTASNLYLEGNINTLSGSLYTLHAALHSKVIPACHVCHRGDRNVFIKIWKEIYSRVLLKYITMGLMSVWNTFIIYSGSVLHAAVKKSVQLNINTDFSHTPPPNTHTIHSLLLKCTSNCKQLSIKQ